MNVCSSTIQPSPLGPGPVHRRAFANGCTVTVPVGAGECLQRIEPADEGRVIDYRLGFGADYTGTDTITVYPTEGAQLTAVARARLVARWLATHLSRREGGLGHEILLALTPRTAPGVP